MVVAIIRLRVTSVFRAIRGLFSITSFNFIIFREYSLCNFTVINFHFILSECHYVILYIGSVS